MKNSNNRILAKIILLAALLTLVACGGTSTPTQDNNQTTSASTDNASADSQNSVTDETEETVENQSSAANEAPKVDVPQYPTSPDGIVRPEIDKLRATNCYSSPLGGVYWNCEKEVIPADFNGGLAKVDTIVESNQAIIVISQVRIFVKDLDDQKTIDLILNKEVEANAIALEWYGLNELRELGWPDMTSFADGAANLYLADQMVQANIDGVFNVAPGEPFYLTKWDGTSAPTCQHLFEIQAMWQSGDINGDGVPNMLIKYGCTQ